jgi:hypothetical protein
VIAQLEEDIEGEDALVIRKVEDQSLVRVPRTDVKAIRHFPINDTRRIALPEDAVLSAACSVALELCPKAGRIVIGENKQMGVTLCAQHGMTPDLQLRVVPSSTFGEVSDRREAIVQVSQIYRIASAVTMPVGVELKAGDMAFPHESRRVHLAVCPPKVDPGFSGDVARLWASRSRKIAEDIRDRLQNDFHIPQLGSSEELGRIDKELDRPGLNPLQSVAPGRRIGATHVLTGALFPVPGKEQHADLKLRLLDAETGEEVPLVSGSVRIHYRL